MGNLLTKKDHRQNAMIHVFNTGYIVSLLLFLAGSIGSFCDSVVASRALGVSELAVIGLIYPYNKFMECISLVLSSGSQVIISRKIGKSRFDEVSSVFFTSLIALAAVGILLAAIIFAVTEPLSVFLGASSSGKTLNPTVTYLRSLAVGAPAYLLTLYLIPLLQLDGEKHLINIATIAMTAVNIVLNLKFVSLGFGIGGIGYSTSISYFFGLMLLLTHFLGKKKGILFQGKFRLNAILLPAILKEGCPAAFKSLTSIIFNLFLSNFVARFGSTEALAALSVFKTTKFIFLSADEALVNPVRMIQSMLFEEKDLKMLRIIYKHAISLTLFLSVGLSSLIWAFGRPMFSFIVSGAVLDEAVVLMNYASVDFVLSAFINYYQAHFQAINRKRFSYLVSIFLNIVPIPCICLLGHAFGIEGIWMGIALEGVITAVFAVLCACILGRKNRRIIDKLLALPQPKEAYRTYDYHIASKEDATVALDVFSSICKNSISDSKKACYLCLAFEEIVFNILEYESAHGEGISSIDIHILIKENGKILIRIKDLSRKRNPFEIFEYKAVTDDLENLGIRMVKTFADDVKYSYIYNINFITITL